MNEPTNVSIRRNLLMVATAAFAAVFARTRTATAAAAAEDPQQPDLATQVKRLAEQVRALEAKAQAAEDYIAISNLQRSYGYYVDKSRWDDVADLFARDATLEINGRGVFVGQDRVRQYMHHFGPAADGVLMNHMQLQPVIHLGPDGRTAKARWRAFIQAGQFGKVANWGEGTYENTYVKEGGVWKIKSLHFYQNFYVDFYSGWDKSALPLVPEYTDLPPDRPPSEPYKVYPRYFLPAYHYANPVSGRAS